MIPIDSGRPSAAQSVSILTADLEARVGRVEQHLNLPLLYPT